MELKLNKRRTFFIACIFFAILLLWQVYYFYTPLYLENLLVKRYGDKNYADIIGHIMSLDNLASIIIIPTIGYLSDRTKSRLGQRMPYIIAGTIASLILFPLIAAMYLLNSFAWYFVVVILLVICMAFFRAPAVSLMPDVTPKPLRTSANAIINFIGYIGAIIGSGLTIVFTMKNESLTIIPFIVTSVLLAIVICLFIFKFNEPKIIAEMKPQLLHGEKHSQTLAKVHADKPLSKGDRINFYIIVVCIFFCWFSFQSLQTFGSLYGELVLKTDEWGICTTALAISSLATFLPSTWLSTKIGRKWSVVSGFAVIIIAMVIAALFATKMPFAVMPVLFAFSGVGWAIVMVNSYPEFVELSHQKNVGRVTGIYYLVSQAAMFITTNVSGYVFKFAGYGFYFYYSIIFMTVALVVCLFLKTKNRGKHSLE